jgi:hypothetical protein
MVGGNLKTALAGDIIPPDEPEVLVAVGTTCTAKLKSLIAIHAKVTKD